MVQWIEENDSGIPKYKGINYIDKDIEGNTQIFIQFQTKLFECWFENKASTMGTSNKALLLLGIGDESKGNQIDLWES